LRKQLGERLGMSVDSAKAVDEKGIGSDVATGWKVTPGNLRPLYDWPASCRARGDSAFGRETVLNMVAQVHEVGMTPVVRRTTSWWMEGT